MYFIKKFGIVYKNSYSIIVIMSSAGREQLLDFNNCMSVTA